MEAHWIDNHCHLDGEDDPAAVIADARAAGVEELVCVGTSVERSLACGRLASTHDHVWATAGVHPHDASAGTGGLVEVLEEGRDSGTIVAVGECGLDYHYDNSPRAVQREVFAQQVGLAHDLGLPLVIHTREAWEDTFDVLDSEGIPARTVFHCFTGGSSEAEAGLARGAVLSISGIVTFDGAEKLRRAVQRTPLSSLMVETDSPYLAPVPHRGERNRPALVRHVGECIAALHGVGLESVARATSENARAFYALPRNPVPELGP